MTDPSDIDRLALELASLWPSAGRIPADTPPDSATAYAVQAATMAHLGPVAGFKFGRLPDGTFFYAPIPERWTQATPGNRTTGETGELGVELEVGLRLLEAPPPVDTPDLAAAFAKVVEPVAVIEIVDTRLSGDLATEPTWKLADMQVNAGLVVGATAGPQDLGEGKVTARFLANGEPMAEGEMQILAGNPLEGIAALHRALGDHCGGLQSGQIVITGALCGLRTAAKGTEVTGVIEGIGSVAVTIG